MPSPRLDSDERIGEFRGGAELGQACRVSQYERRPQRIPCCFPGQPLHQLDFGRVGRCVRERGPDRHGESPNGHQYPPHLPEARHGVGKEHKAELADDGIERLVGEGQCVGAALLPLQRGTHAGRNCEHLGA